MKKQKLKTTYFKRAYFHPNLKFVMFTWYGIFKFNGSRKKAKKAAQLINHGNNLCSNECGYENMAYFA